MCELNETAFEMALAESVITTSDFEKAVTELCELFNEEQNPALLALQRSAHEHDVPFLWDDDEVSVGYGKSALVWNPDHLPSPEMLEWHSISSIPVALVTGTNGKSTTVRMAAAIMAASASGSGQRSGVGSR